MLGYDADSNVLIRKGDTITLTYDTLNRPIVAVCTPAPAQALPAPATVTFTHAYDATNRRVGQTASDSGWWSYPTTAGMSR